MKKRVFFKIASILLIVAIVVGVFSIGTFASNQGIDVISTVSEIDSNNRFTVRFDFENNTGIMGYKLTLSYVTGCIRPIAVNVGSAFASGNMADTIGVEQGFFNVLWNNLTEVVENGTAFLVTFEYLKNENTQILMSYSPDDTFDGDFEGVVLNLSDTLSIIKKSVSIVGDFRQFDEGDFLKSGTLVLTDSNETIVHEEHYENGIISDTRSFETLCYQFTLKPKNRVSFTCNHISSFLQETDISSILGILQSKGI